MMWLMFRENISSIFEKIFILGKVILFALILFHLKFKVLNRCGMVKLKSLQFLSKHAIWLNFVLCLKFILGLITKVEIFETFYF